MIFFQDKLLKVITEAQLAKILSFYGRFAFQSFTPKSGWKNLILKITTNSGVFNLRIYRSKNLKKINLSLEVMKYLKSRRFSLPTFVKTKTGKRIIIVEFGKFTQPAVLFRYLEGKICPVLTPSEISQFGQLVGKLHLALEEYQPLTKPAPKLNLWHFERSVKRQIEEKFKNYPQVFNLWKKFDPILTESLISATSVFSESQLIHGDLTSSNILFKIQNEDNLAKPEITAILDFDEVKLAPRIYDLANFVGNYTQTLRSLNNFEPVYQILASLLSGYEKYGRLQEKEKLLLPIIVRLWFFKKIIWAQGETTKKYRQKWAKEIISWCIEALKEEF